MLFRSQYNIELQHRIYLTAASISVGFNHVLFDLCISSYYHKSKRTALNVKTRLACTRTHDSIHINALRFTGNKKIKKGFMFIWLIGCCTKITFFIFILRVIYPMPFMFLLFRKIHCNWAILKCRSMIWQDTVEVSNKVHGDWKYIKSHSPPSIITTMSNVMI